MRKPDIGSTATAQVRVTAVDLASAVRFAPEDEFPAVFATARMVALMEVASARVLRPHLEGDELSVGVAVDVQHTAATPPGALVIATARLIAMEGKFYVFEVSASDDAGEVGRGTHKRAVVSSARLEAGAAKRGVKVGG